MDRQRLLVQDGGAVQRALLQMERSKVAQDVCLAVPVAGLTQQLQSLFPELLCLRRPPLLGSDDAQRAEEDALPFTITGLAHQRQSLEEERPGLPDAALVPMDVAQVPQRARL